LAGSRTNLEAPDALVADRLSAAPPPVLLRILLYTVAGAAMAGWLVLAAVHVSDDYHVTHVQGVWIAAAESARAGRLYPPLFDGEHYAGTRYMPLAILLNALAAGLVDDPLIGGKLVAALLMATLLGLVVVILRGFSCPWPVAIASASIVVATATGLQAGTTIGGDLLPVVLQVGALAAAIRAPSRPAIVIAGMLAGLAVASKLTGLWALLGITTWMAARQQWRPAITCAAVGIGTATIVLGTVQVVSGGGLTQHLLAFWAAGVHGGVSTVLRAPNQILYNLLASASGAVVLLPLVALGGILSGGWRRLPVVHVAFAYALLVLLVVYADVGTGSNQLLDVVVLTVLAAGHLAGRADTATDPWAGRVLVLAVAITVLWAAALDLVRTLAVDLRRTAAAMQSGEARPRAANVVASMMRADEEVLAEDPAIYVASGRRPLLMDAFMLARIDRLHPRWVDPFIAHIEERRFGLVVLVVSLEDRSVDFWWTDYHFGPRIANALRASYRFDRSVGRYYLYRPVSVAPARQLPGIGTEPRTPAGGRPSSVRVGEGFPAS